MRILSPVCTAEETAAVIAAGASELYGGVMTGAWQKNYTNVASPNRREWRVSNMRDFDELARVVAIAHEHDAKVFMTLNALYTVKQYPAIEQQVRAAARAGADALIVADLGVMLKLREWGWERDIHVSTGGVAFNSESILFYRDIGASRVILDRQNRVSEICELAASAPPGMEIETFILNRGCKNIDGFCTFQHGINEVQIPLWWNLPKRLHFDYYILNILKRLPAPLRYRVSRTKMVSADSACFLPYETEIDSATASESEKQTLERNLKENFNLFNGFDTCGACALWDLTKAGVCSVKIVGRSNPTAKKLKDVGFLRACLDFLERENPDRPEYIAFARSAYREFYGFNCRQWCYYPEQDREIPGGEL